MLRVRDLRGVHGFYASHSIATADGTVISFWLDTGETYRWVHIQHHPAEHPWLDPEYQIAMMLALQPFGGLRWRFVCPERGRPCGVLCLPMGAEQFASRQAHGLAFSSQRLRASARAAVRAQRIRLNLGLFSDGKAFRPRRPIRAAALGALLRSETRG